MSALIRGHRPLQQTFINLFIHSLYTYLPSAYYTQGGEPTVGTRETRCSKEEKGRGKHLEIEATMCYQYLLQLRGKKRRWKRKFIIVPWPIHLLFRKNRNADKSCDMPLALRERNRGVAESHPLFVGDRMQ